MTTKDWSGATSVTRVRFAVWLCRSLGFERLLAMPTALATSFSDMGSLTIEERNAIALVGALGLMQVRSNVLFDPTSDLTRAEFAEAMVRLSQ